MKDGQAFTDLCFTDPAAARELLYEEIRGHLKPELHHLVEEHFAPSYLPWRERIAVVPDGDLFHAMNDGKASVVTDQIATFTENGIELESGDVLEADIVVTATGFNLSALGDVAFTIDDEPLDFHETVTYRGAMFTGIPNMVWVFGYFRASWTLRADLIAHLVCRHPEPHARSGCLDRGARNSSPRRPNMALGPWIDPGELQPGLCAPRPPSPPEAGRPRSLAARARVLERPAHLRYLGPRRRPPEVLVTDLSFGVGPQLKGPVAP